MSDDELAEKLKAGDEAAFAQLYERHARSLLRHLVTVLGNQQEAEEVLHESMMTMIQKINFYSPKPELPNSFKSWMFRLATNRAIDEVRKRKSKGDLRIVNTVAATEETYAEKEEQDMVARSVRELSPMQRTVLGLRVHDDLSYQEISVIVGRDVNTVKQGLFQARKSLKKILGELL